MALERFIPKSPDPFIRNSQDFEVAKFGHLNTIIEYINSYVVTDSLQLAGSGPITSTARYISDSTGVNSAISISTIGVGIGTDTPTYLLDVVRYTIGSVNNNYQFRILNSADGLYPYSVLLLEHNNRTGVGNAGGATIVIKDGFANVGRASIGFDYFNSGSYTNGGGTLRLSNDGQGNLILATGGVDAVRVFKDQGVQIGGISTNLSSTARLLVKGSGSTSATTALLVQNSGAVDLLRVQDNGVLTLGTFASGLGKIVVTSDPSYSIKTIMENNFGGQIIRQVSTDVIWFGGQTQAGLFANNLMNLVAPSIYGNNPQGNTTGSSFNFFVTASPYAQTPSTASRGVLFNGNVVFQSGGYANYFELSPTYSFDSSNGRIIRGIYYNPTLVTPNTNDKHYGIQTTSGGAYINTTTPQASACLQADSTTQGLLPPRMTTTQKNAIASPAAGLMVYDTNLNKLCVYTGAGWETITSV
jgi:hypothetical protein